MTSRFQREFRENNPVPQDFKTLARIMGNHGTLENIELKQHIAFFGDGEVSLKERNI